MSVRICNDEDLKSMYEILYSHDKIAGLKTPNTSFESFKNKFNDNIITFGYFENDQLVSFLVTRKLLELPSWVVSMISIKKSSFFKAEESGLPYLFDAATDFWESKNIYSFVIIQSIKHRNLLNGRLVKLSRKLQTYKIPGETLEIIPKNTKSQSTLINDLCKENTYPVDKIVKWVFKKDYLQEEFK